MAGPGLTISGVYNKSGAGVRKMEATRLLAAFPFLILLFVGVYFYNKSVKSIAPLALPLILVVAVGFIYWIKAIGDEAEACSKREVNARRGTVAEGDAGNLLGELPAGISVVNDFVSKRGNIDHIVVSRKGLLTVERNSHRGVVSCEGDLLKRDGEPFEVDLIKQACSKAYSIRDFLTEKGVCNLKPQPVILFTDADVQVKKKLRGVHVIGGKDLNAFLEGSPAWLSERLAKNMIDCLRK